MSEPLPPAVQTPEATRAVSATRADPDGGPSSEALPRGRGEGELFRVADHLYRAAQVDPYDRRRDDPVYRPLRIYTLDPAESRFVGAQATVNVPYEPLQPGPVSGLFEVIDEEPQGRRHRGVELDDPKILIGNGLPPSATDYRFHQQMVYAVATTTYAAFQRALGRTLHWGFDRRNRFGQPEQPVRLRLYPHWGYAQNAYYDKLTGAVRFGYFDAGDDPHGRNLPGGTVYTCLSHDIIAHEITHALLDGLRPHFTEPTNPDVLALHEALGDLVAIFQHFSYEAVLAASIARGRGNLTAATLLTDLARQFGHTIGRGTALRSAIDVVEDGQPTGADDPPRHAAGIAGRKCYDAGLPPHDLGSVLVSAIFDAFNTIYRRKTRDYVLLATGGTGVLPQGEIPLVLQRLLAKEASGLASQFLSICLRALDYCPPVDITFGDYLRALITADFDLVPDDPWGYRETLIDAFRLRRIYPQDVDTLAEEALLWRPPPRDIHTGRLSFAELRFRGDPGQSADGRELHAQACELGRLIAERASRPLFGLTAEDDPRLGGDRVDLPEVESVRTSRRVGPDGQLVFDLIAEVVQRRWVPAGDGLEFPFLGGATIIFGPDGVVRYAISKNILSNTRLAAQRAYAGDAGRALWEPNAGRLCPLPQPFRLLHASRPAMPGR